VSTDQPLRYEHVADLIEGQIESGALKPSERVPSLRTMSRSAGVSVGTVVQAYLHLERRGLLETRPRSGFFVASRPPAAEPRSKAARKKLASRRPHAVAPKVVDTVLASLARTDLVALNSAVVDSASRLNGRLNSLTRRILRERPELPNRFYFPPGDEGLRQEIAKRMALAGASVSPDDIVITGGTTEAIALSLGVLCRPGDTVLVESPTYFGILQLLEHLGLKVVEVPNRADEGIDVDALEYVVSGTRIAAAVLQSSFNNPTGAMTPPHAKQRILRMLEAHGIPLVEDDVYGELHLGAERNKPYCAFDGSGAVITCGSISKSMALGYRLGWAISSRWAAEIRRAKFCVSVAAPTLQQHVVALYLAAGTHDRHLRRMRESLHGNIQRFIDALGRYFPAGTRVANPAGGVVLWVELPKQVDGFSLFHAALARRIGIAPGMIFSANGDYSNYIRLSAGVRWTPEVEEAVRTLGRLAAKLARDAGV
jgi:DNA-binding transcriptional MocR family regulator